MTMNVPEPWQLYPMPPEQITKIQQYIDARIAQAEAPIRRVRALCQMVLNADTGGPFPAVDDPTPVPGWVALVENALDGRTEHRPA